MIWKACILWTLKNSIFFFFFLPHQLIWLVALQMFCCCFDEFCFRVLKNVFSLCSQIYIFFSRSVIVPNWTQLFKMYSLISYISRQKNYYSTSAVHMKLVAGHSLITLAHIQQALNYTSQIFSYESFWLGPIFWKYQPLICKHFMCRSVWMPLTHGLSFAGDWVSYLNKIMS